MQSRTLKPRKNYPKHVELAVAPPDPNTSYAHILELVGERKKVLDVGCASGYLASLFVKRECDVVGIDINPIVAEEARRYCTSVIVADLDQSVIPELVAEQQFDVIVFGDVLEHLHEPARTLDESRAMLSERGYVVASIPNVSHGAIRLALLTGRFDYQDLGILDDAHMRFFTAKTIDELFLTAGYRIDAIARVSLPLFSDSDLVPALDPRDFDEKAVAEIKADPDGETLQFIVKAYPLTNDQRLRTISKRFLTANTELTANKQQIAHREAEVQRLRGELSQRETTLQRLRDDTNDAQAELGVAQARFEQLEDAYRTLEIDASARQNAAMERALATQVEHARATESIGELQAKLKHYERIEADAEQRTEQANRETASLRAQVQQLDGALMQEHGRAGKLAEIAQTLESNADNLRSQVASLTKERLQFQGQLQEHLLRAERLGGELGAERDRAAALHRRSLTLESEFENRMQVERTERDAQAQAQMATMQSAIQSLDANMAVASRELERTRAALHSERQRSFESIARVESACDALLNEAAEEVALMRSQCDAVQDLAEATQREEHEAVADLREQLDAVRKASLTDKLVMREYADESRHRAEHLEKEFESAIRQRDDMYLRVLEGERVIKEGSEYRDRLESHVKHVEENLSHERQRREAADAALAETGRRSEETIADLKALSEATIADLKTRARSLDADLTHQQAVIEHLREKVEDEKRRADAAATDLASVTVRQEIAQARIAEMDNMLVAQTEQLLASTSDERNRILTLIDTVQSSHFWRLKNWLARLRTRLHARGM